MLQHDYFHNVHGAVYFPSRAYNAYQTYQNFSREECLRDFSYAQQAGINALRIFTSYEFWQEDAKGLFNRFDQLLDCAREYGIRVMPVLFEDCGRPNTIESRNSHHPLEAICVRSPGIEVEQDPQRWKEAEAYVAAFFSRYADDSRLLAIEIMNEPHRQRGNLPFAKHLVRYAAQFKKTIPITLGCINIEDNLCFADEIDIFQFHDNFPATVEQLQTKLSTAKAIQEISGKPCWITEWQRLRPTGPGWHMANIPEEDKLPCLASMACTIRSSGLGNFFWSLMVKPAYLKAQRINGTFNGLFHEDGTVYSQADFVAISGCSTAPAETPTMPAWYLADLAALENT